MKTRATLTVHGPGQLRGAFRKRLRDILRDEAPEVKCADASASATAADALALALDAPLGIPFPQLIEVSLRYPDCVAVVAWTQNAAEGETTIQNGQVKEAAGGATLSRQGPQYLQLARDCSLVLGFTLDVARDGWLGYCASADAETYFKLCGQGSETDLLTIGDAGAAASGGALAWDERWAAGAAACVTLAPPVALAPDDLRTLDKLAAAFRAEWLWYGGAAPEDSAVEMQRYAGSARPVQAINVKSRQLASHSGAIISTLDASQEWVAQRLLETWARPAQTPHSPTRP